MSIEKYEVHTTVPMIDVSGTSWRLGKSGQVFDTESIAWFNRGAPATAAIRLPSGGGPAAEYPIAEGNVMRASIVHAGRIVYYTKL